jgi:toxin ParE1/3/4
MRGRRKAVGARPGKKLRLSHAASDDLYTVWREGVIRWSEDRADAYLLGMEKALERLCDFPEIVRERTELSPPVRAYTYRSHVIIYREAGDFVEVIRIRHGREDWTSDFDADSGQS